MQNQDLQHSFLKPNAKTNNTNYMHLAKNQHMTNGFVHTHKSTNHITTNNNIAINSLNYARIFLLTLMEIEHRLNQLPKIGY